jgi:biofilm protein TabA
MIVGSLQEVAQQCNSSPFIRKALEFLREVPDKALPDGRVQVDGTNVYAIVQSYASAPVSETLRFEAHRQYIDIQFVISGKELMGWAPLKSMMTTIPYNESKDALYGVVSPANVTFVHYGAGQAVVLYPTDAHSPGLADGDSQPVKKVVVKVLVSEE